MSPCPGPRRPQDGRSETKSPFKYGSRGGCTARFSQARSVQVPCPLTLCRLPSERMRKRLVLPAPESPTIATHGSERRRRLIDAPITSAKPKKNPKRMQATAEGTSRWADIHACICTCLQSRSFARASIQLAADADASTRAALELQHQFSRADPALLARSGLPALQCPLFCLFLRTYEIHVERASRSPTLSQQGRAQRVVLRGPFVRCRSAF